MFMTKRGVSVDIHEGKNLHDISHPSSYFKNYKRVGVLYAKYIWDRMQFVSCNYLQIYPTDQSQKNVLLIRLATSSPGGGNN